MIGAIDKLRDRAEAVQARLDEIEAAVAAREGDDAAFTDEELSEYEGLTSDLKGIRKQIEAIESKRQADVTDWLDRRGLAEPGDLADGQPAEFTDGARIESNERRWPTFGHQLLAIMDAGTPGGAVDPRLERYAAATGGSQGVPAEGGYLVDPEFSPTIWDGMNQMPDNLLGRTDQYTITGESLTFKANAETSRATGSRYGGIRGYWIAEADQITHSKPKWRDLRLEPQELAVLVYQTDKTLRNSPVALGQFIQRAASEEINFLVGDSIVNGDGAGKPRGILNSACLITQAKETGQLAATVVAENISKMWSRLHPRSRANAVWLYNVEVEPQLDQLSFAIGTAGQLVYIPAGGLRENAVPMLKGRPMIAIEYAAALGTAGDLILADLGAFATGVRGGAAGGIRSAESIHIRFDYAETAFRIMFEADGQAWLQSAITPFKGSNTLSSFVALAARA